MASDFAVPKFRYLERLLIVHGHWCYSRLANMVLYFFYKNTVSVRAGLGRRLIRRSGALRATPRSGRGSSAPVHSVPLPVTWAWLCTTLTQRVAAPLPQKARDAHRNHAKAHMTF